MHQTFYIDIDEEITSIVDRLRKAKAKEVVLVIPKRALLVQSIVNLKLLKKEAEGMGIQIMIITQDKLGKILIEKAGILVQNKLDETLEEESVVFEEKEDDLPVDEEEKKEIKEKGHSERVKARVKNIGSESYFSNQEKKDDLRGTDVYLENDEDKDFEKITNKELVTHVSKNLRKKKLFGNKKRKMVDLVNVSKMDISNESDDAKEAVVKKEQKKTVGRLSRNRNDGNLDKLANFFQSGAERKAEVEETPKKEKKKKNKSLSQANIGGKFWKTFLIFGLLAGLTFALVAAYLFLPKVDIVIHPKVKTASQDFEIQGKADISEVDFTNQVVPIREIEASDEFTQEFSSSGEEGISNQKARGTITIYNEYSSSSQQLVATTRFLTEDGKLFRLVSGVTIPGVTTENGEEKPGTVDAQVVADEAGDEYNIGPTKFSIPGFKSSGEEKYSKFYAVSSESMTGGGSGNEKVSTVTQSDIDQAKAVLEASFSENNKQALEKVGGEGTIVLDEAMQTEEVQYVSSNSPGEVAEKFSLTAKIKRKALVFSQEDVKNIVAKKIAQENDGFEIENSNISLDFGKADANWETKEMTIRFRATVDMGASLDLANIKKGILGKNEDELKSFLESYSEIEKIDIDYWPFFVDGKIPMYEKRVNITLDKE